MLTIEKGKILAGEKVWLFCVNCIKDITDDVKVTIKGDTYCARCAAEYYDKGGV